jgi:hypothetical protein
MNRNNKQTSRGSTGRSIYRLVSRKTRLSQHEAFWVAVPLEIVWFVLLVFVGQMVAAEQLNPDKFRRMVQTELEKTQVSVDSVGTTMKVMGFGDPIRDFMLAPIIRDGKVVAVYKDDPKRNGVTPLANVAVLKSIRLDLFSQIGAQQVLQERGYTSGVPVAVSVGPCSLFGVLETGWYLQSGESFVLLSLEGRIASESDVARFWPGKMAAFRQIKERLLPKE